LYFNIKCSFLTINSFETVSVHTISGPVEGDHRSKELINKSTNVLLVLNFELTLTIH